MGASSAVKEPSAPSDSRAWRKLAGWLAAGLVLTVAGLLATLLITDLNRFRPQLETLASRAFGRPVVLAGAFDIEPSLRPRLLVRDFRVGNPDWASRPDLARVDELELTIALLPFLQGELQVESVTLAGVDLWLEIDGEGRKNYQLNAGGETGALPAVAELTVHDLQVAWRGPGDQGIDFSLDRVTARNQVGMPVRLAVETELNETPVSAVFEARKDPSRGDSVWDLSLDASSDGVRLDVSGMLASLSDWRPGDYAVRLDAADADTLGRLAGLTLPDVAPIRLAGDLHLDEYGLGGALRNLRAGAGDTEVSGEIGWSAGADRGRVEADLVSNRLHLALPAPDDEAVAPDATGPAAARLLSRLGALDWRLDLRAGTVSGLGRSVSDVHLAIEADERDLAIRSLSASLDEDTLRGSGTFAWGGRLVGLMPESGDWDLWPVLLRPARVNATLSAGRASGLPGLRWSGPPAPVEIDELRLSVRPAAPVEVNGDLRIGGHAVAARLEAEPLAVLLKDPGASWEDLRLALEGNGVTAEGTGRIAEPLAGRGFDMRFDSRGPNVTRLLEVFDLALPVRGDYALSGRFRDAPDRLGFDDLSLRLGNSDLAGHLSVETGSPRSRVTGELNSRVLHRDVWEDPPVRDADAGAPGFDPSPLMETDWDVALNIDRIDGTRLPVTGIELRFGADSRGLRVAPFEVSLGDVRTSGQLARDWPRDEGDRPSAVTLAELLAGAEGEARVLPVESEWRYERTVMGFAKDVRIGRLDVAVLPGEPVNVQADTTVNGEQVTAALRLDSLAGLAERPRGPWRNIGLEFRQGTASLTAEGRIERPLELAGVDAVFTLRGPDVAELLPLIDFILPLQGAVSVTGRMTDAVGSTRFEDLEIAVGKSDLKGSVTITQGEARPWMELDLAARKIDLGELFTPAVEESPFARDRVIPEQEYPVERLRSIDGRLRFAGAQLVLGDRVLGDVRVEADLEDGRLTLQGLEVEGWGGARIRLAGSLDGSRAPPAVTYELRVRDLQYATFLGESDFASRVEGSLNATVFLRGTGHSRREMLAGANGQIVVVGGPGRIGNRLVDLWGADLVTTLLSPQWIVRNDTRLTCLVARIDVADGVATMDDLLLDTERVTVAAAGSLDLGSEILDLVIAPRPKQASLVSLANPARVSGPLGSPEISRTTLPRERMAAAGAGLLAGVVNPALLLFTLSRTGTGEANPCVAAVEDAEALKEALLPGG